MCLDLDAFSHNEIMNKDYFLKEEWFQNVHDPEKFLVYENIVEIGEKYPALVNEVIGEHKVLYTPKDNKTFITYVAKTDKIPEWAKG